MNKTSSLNNILRSSPTAPQQVLLDVVNFWKAAGPVMWFQKNKDFDRIFRDRYKDSYPLACAEQLCPKDSNAEEHLGLVLLLDQYPRNSFRGTPQMYSSDTLAQKWADFSLTKGMDNQIDKDLRLFFYLPFAHSEDVEYQERSVQLNRPLGHPFIDHALDHCKIIRSFGRFPHRNSILGRLSTAEEDAFLASGGFSG